MMSHTSEENTARLAARLAAHVGTSRDGDDLRAHIEEAEALVMHHVGTRSSSVPGPILERAIIECAGDLFWRRRARNGIATFESDGALETVRIGSDPLRSAKTILAPWMGVPIA